MGGGSRLLVGVSNMRSYWHAGMVVMMSPSPGGGLVDWSRPNLVHRRMSRTPGFGTGEGWPWQLLQRIGHIEMMCRHSWWCLK